MNVASITVEDAAATRELRRAVLRPTWAPGSAMPGDEHADALHLAARAADGTMLGACVLLLAPCPHRPGIRPAWQLRGMATAESARGQGVGTALLRAALDGVRARGARLLWCKARVTALGFYSANGFTVDSDEYVEPNTGLPHRDMSRPVGDSDMSRPVGDSDMSRPLGDGAVGGPPVR